MRQKMRQWLNIRWITQPDNNQLIMSTLFVSTNQKTAGHSPDSQYWASPNKNRAKFLHHIFIVSIFRQSTRRRETGWCLVDVVRVSEISLYWAWPISRRYILRKSCADIERFSRTCCCWGRALLLPSSAQPFACRKTLLKIVNRWISMDYWGHNESGIHLMIFVLSLQKGRIQIDVPGHTTL